MAAVCCTVTWCIMVSVACSCDLLHNVAHTTSFITALLCRHLTFQFRLTTSLVYALVVDNACHTISLQNSEIILGWLVLLDSRHSQTVGAHNMFIIRVSLIRLFIIIYPPVLRYVVDIHMDLVMIVIVSRVSNLSDLPSCSLLSV